MSTPQFLVLLSTLWAISSAHATEDTAATARLVVAIGFAASALVVWVL